MRVEGTDRVVKKMQRIPANVYDEVGDELDDIGVDAKAASRAVAPRDTGLLRKQAFHYVDVEGVMRLVLVVGYDGPPDYLLVQHEGGWLNFMGDQGPKRIRNYTTPGTGAKFLENPWTENKGKYKMRVRAAGKRGLRR